MNFSLETLLRLTSKAMQEKDPFVWYAFAPEGVSASELREGFPELLGNAVTLSRKQAEVQGHLAHGTMVGDCFMVAVVFVTADLVRFFAAVTEDFNETQEEA